MNFEYFIVRRFIRSSKSKVSVSSSISKIGVISIALGLIMMLIAVSTGKGLQREIKNKLISFNGHIQVSYYDTNNSEVSIKPFSYSSDLEDNMLSINGVRYLCKVATKGGVIRTNSSFDGILAKGVEADYIEKNITPYIVEGKPPDFSSNLNEQALISEFLSKRLNLKVGDRFQILFFNKNRSVPSQRYMKVSGIYNSGFQEFDANYIFLDIRHIQRINHWEFNEIGHFEVFINDIEKTFQINKEIYNRTPSDMDAKTIQSKYEVVMEWLNLMDYNIYIIIGIMIIIGGVNMITTMLITVLERTRTIGVLKAIGADDWSISKICIYQAVYLIGLGLFFGNLIGLGLIFLQSKFGFIKLNPEVYYVSVAPVDITFLEIMTLNVGTLILSVLMLIIPSLVVSKLPPTKIMQLG